MTRFTHRLGRARDVVARRLAGRSARRRVVNRITLAELEAEGWRSVEPVFVLSTGRCGTKLLSELLEAAGGAMVAHSPRPELIRVSKRAFEEIEDNPDLFVELIKTAREESIWEAHRFGATYVETNNRITFFAPALARAFPNARFVHLVRNPAAIVRSGIRRRWYEGHPYDIGRIRPPNAAPGWNESDPIAKIGWLWQATNAFVERFRKTVPEERFLLTRAEELFANPDAAAQIIRFCGLEPPSEKRIAAALRRRVNPQVRGEFPRFEEWTEQQRELLRREVPLAERYGYRL